MIEVSGEIDTRPCVAVRETGNYRCVLWVRANQIATVSTAPCVTGPTP